MSTKYPIAYDDSVTLGGPFIDVSPPVDPQRNIAAEFRNNMNDAVVAVQERVGYLDDPATDTIDWGLLTVSSAPNQGLRFAGSHVQWPGATGEAGLFINSANSHVSFHQAGDPLGTFTDLTAGGSTPTWDDIYSGDKSLDISAAALVFTQTSTVNYGFEVLRNQATAALPIVHIANQNASNAQSALYVNNSQAAGVASNSAASFLSVSTGLTGGTEVLNAIKAQVDANATDAAGAELRAFYADVGGTAGAATSVGYYATANLRWGVHSKAPVYIDVDTTGVPFLVGCVISDTAVAGDTIPFVILEGALPTPTAARFVAHRNGQIEIDAENTTRALGITQSDSTTGDQPIVELNDGNLGQPRYKLYQRGKIEHTPANPTSSFTAHRINSSSGGLAGGNTWRALVLDLTGNGADSSPTVYGSELNLNANGGTYSTAYGVYVHGDWNYGIYAENPVYVDAGASTLVGMGIDSNSTATALVAGQSGSGNIFEAKDGSVSGGTSRFWVSSDGDVNVNGNSALSALRVGQIGSGSLLTLYNGTVGGSQVLNVTTAGATTITSNSTPLTIEASSTTSAILVGQSSTGSLIELKDGTSGGGTLRFQVTELGAAAVTTHSTVTATALTVTQNSTSQNGLYVTGAASTAYGVSVANTWAYGVYTLSPIYVSTTSSAGYPAITLIQNDLDKHGLDVSAGSTNSANAVNVDANWAYGLSTLSPVYVSSGASAGFPSITLVQADLDKDGINITSSGTNTAYAVSVGNNWAYGLRTLSPVYIAPPNDTQALDVNCTITDGTASSISGMTLDMYRTVALSGNGRNVFGIETTMYEFAADASTLAAEHAAFRAVFNGAAPATDTDIKVNGFSVTNGFKAGFYGESPILIELDAPILGIVSAFCYVGASPGIPLIQAKKGTQAAGTTRFEVNSEGRTTIFCEDASNYALTVTSNLSSTSLLHLYDDVTNTSRVTVARDGKTNITSNATTGYAFSVNGDDASINLLQLYDDVNNLDRFTVALNGATSIASAFDVSGQGAVTVNNAWTTNADGMVLRLLAANVDRFYVQNNGIARFGGANSLTSPLLELDQTTNVQGFADFQGQSLAGHTGNVSAQQGDGSVVGPQAKNAASGWTFYRMVKIEVNGVEAWVATYQPDDV